MRFLSLLGIVVSGQTYRKCCDFLTPRLQTKTRSVNCNLHPNGCKIFRLKSCLSWIALNLNTYFRKKLLSKISVRIPMDVARPVTLMTIISQKKITISYRHVEILHWNWCLTSYEKLSNSLSTQIHQTIYFWPSNTFYGV